MTKRLLQASSLLGGAAAVTSTAARIWPLAIALLGVNGAIRPRGVQDPRPTPCSWVRAQLFPPRAGIDPAPSDTVWTRPLGAWP